MTRAVLPLALALPLAALSFVAAACGPAVGSEGGACTDGGGCDPGLTCLSDLCVDAGEGEGEGEGDCAGDEDASASEADCSGIAIASCADQQGLAACTSSARTLRSGVFQAAFDCLSALPGCDGLGDAVVDCFAGIVACEDDSAAALCAEAVTACEDTGDAGFPEAACVADLTPVNEAFRARWSECFNTQLDVPCADIHDGCYEDAFATLVEGT